jgi:hypothetical protein
MEIQRMLILIAVLIGEADHSFGVPRNDTWYNKLKLKVMRDTILELLDKPTLENETGKRMNPAVSNEVHADPLGMREQHYCPQGCLGVSVGVTVLGVTAF